MTNQTVRNVTHSVYVPPLTDQTEFLGCYKTLLDTLGIKNNIPVGGVNSFSHPIPEENDRLTSEFMSTMQILRSLVLDFPKIECVNVRVTGTSATFTLAYLG